jgi:hypothetical protein
VQDACVGPCLFSFSDVILVVGMAPLIWWKGKWIHHFQKAYLCLCV